MMGGGAARPRIPIVPLADSASSVGGTKGHQASAAHASAGLLTALPPLSLYIHLPWCLRKCPYCDFNSHEWRGEPGALRAPDAATQARYRRALVADLESALPLVWGRPVHSVFIGGGTPSLFDPQEIDALLADVRSRMRLEPGCEVTLEANPGTFERSRFRAYAQAGVTRLSVGVQSFDDAALKALGRVHGGEQARAAVQEAAEVFETWNLDLMYALPGQTMEGLEADVQTALSFAPPHLSLYHLTLEPNTLFATRPPKGLPDDDAAYAMLDRLIECTQTAGMERYEISAFARPGHRCTHNLNYWRFGDYLGIGAGAHGKISFPDRLVRQVRWREPEAYMQAAEAGRAVSNEHPIDLAERPFEFMLNGLRLIDGVSLRSFGERTGLQPEVLLPVLQRAVSRGLLQTEAGVVRATPKGLDFLSDVQEMFLADTA